MRYVPQARAVIAGSTDGRKIKIDEINCKFASVNLSLTVFFRGRRLELIDLSGGRREQETADGGRAALFVDQVVRLGVFFS